MRSLIILIEMVKSRWFPSLPTAKVQIICFSEIDTPVKVAFWISLVHVSCDEAIETLKIRYVMMQYRANAGCTDPHHLSMKEGKDISDQ
jgi:hypothetical protein